jgi:hypothetical protein
MLALVAGQTFGIAENYDANIALLYEFFNDSDEAVRKQSTVFLNQIQPDDFDKYKDTIYKYVSSPAFESDNDNFFRLLKETSCNILDCLITVSKLVIENPKGYKDGFYLSEIIELLKDYYSVSESTPEHRKVILDIIDMMLENSVYGVEEILKTHER